MGFSFSLQFNSFVAETLEMAYRNSRARHLLAAAIFVAVDFVLSIPGRGADDSVRAIIVLALWVVLLRLVPLESTSEYPNWSSWKESLRLTAKISAIVLGVLVLLTGIAVLAIGFQRAVVDWHPFAMHPDESVLRYALHGLVAAPIVEEFIYRGVVHPRLDRALGSRWAIFVGGFVFWGLHWVYFQGISPVNHLVAGWILGYAYWKTRSLVAPTLLHLLGNLMLMVMDLWVRNYWHGA